MVVHRSCSPFRPASAAKGSSDDGLEPTPSCSVAPEHGQAVPLVAATLALTVVLALGVVRLAVGVTDRARAHTSADAAALAGAAEGRSAAEEVARANGGVLVTFEQVGGQVEVRVRVRDMEAVARAELTR